MSRPRVYGNGIRRLAISLYTEGKSTVATAEAVKKSGITPSPSASIIAYWCAEAGVLRNHKEAVAAAWHRRDMEKLSEFTNGRIHGYVEMLRAKWKGKPGDTSKA